MLILPNHRFSATFHATAYALSMIFFLLLAKSRASASRISRSPERTRETALGGP